MTARARYPSQRTRADRRPAPQPTTLAGDNIDRIVRGVRIVGSRVIHRRAATGSTGCGLCRNRAAHLLVLTTAPVDCRERGCA